MKKIINFDMDGTLADFYGVPNWLEKIRAFDASPYVEAKPLVNMSVLARRLNNLQKKGYVLRILTWGSKESNEQFDYDTFQAKKYWLRKHLPSVHWDEIVFSVYGVRKSILGKGAYAGKGILFDDNEKVRNSWTGTAYTETEILPVLKTLG